MQRRRITDIGYMVGQAGQARGGHHHQLNPRARVRRGVGRVCERERETESNCLRIWWDRLDRAGVGTTTNEP